MSRKIKDYLMRAIYIAIPLVVISGLVYLEIGLWQECRMTNSWFYCMRILGSR